MPAAVYPISRYLNIHSAYAPGLAADGQHVAFLSNASGIPQLWRVEIPAPGGVPLWPDQLTFAVERVLGVRSSPAEGDGRLIYARDVGGDENAQLFLLSPDGSEVPLTAGHEGAMHVLGHWSTDAQSILFAANRRDPGLFDLYRQPLDGVAALIWQNDQPGFVETVDLSPDGRHAAVCRMGSGSSHDLFEVDLTSGEARRVNPADEQARYEAVWYAADGRSLYVDTDYHSDFLYVARLDLASGTLQPVVTAAWDVECLTRSPDGRWLAYVVNVNGASDLRLLDLSSGQERHAPAFSPAAGVVAMMEGYLTFSPDSARLAFSFTSAVRTSDIFVWDLAADTVQAVTRSSHAGLAPDSFTAPEVVHYTSFDGRRIPAWSYKPTAYSGRPYPVIVVVHGGPEAQFQPYFQPIIQYFLHHGYAVLAPNVRGSTGYGKAYSHLDDVEKRLDAVADLAAAAYWLQRQPDIDGDRLAVYGGSYGGFMVLAALTLYPDLWAAGVDIVGISNMVTFLENTSAYRRAHREAEYGSLAHDREFLTQISPLNHVDQITAPLIVIHGANDPRVPLTEAEQMVAALKARNVPVEFLVFADEGHGLVRLKNKEVAYRAIVAFLEQNGIAPSAERHGEPMKARLLELVEEEYRALQETLAQVPPERLTEPGVVGTWSVKDILAHIAAWQGRMVRWVTDALRGEVPQVLPAGMTWGDLDRWNEQTYLENRDRSLAEVLDQVARSYSQALEATRAATEDELFDPAHFPWREGRPLWPMVAANTFWHHAEHAQAIGQWLRRGREDLTPGT